MAINFEAANMAGYNNPKIEVFKATLAEDGQTLAQYPAKAAIMAAVNRGSIPLILFNITAPASQQCLLILHDVMPVEDSVAINFTAASLTAGDHTIVYTPEPNGVPQYVAAQ